MSEHYASRLAMLDVWLALGGTTPTFEKWMAHPKRTSADAWAQLMAAVRNDIAALVQDTNPPAGELANLSLSGNPDDSGKSGC